MNKLAILLLAIGMAACNAPQTKPEEQKVPDFNKSFWGDSPEQVVEAVNLGDPNSYPDGLLLELEWEGDFLGVKTNLDDAIVARQAYFFDNAKLQGAWYYIMAYKTDFDAEAKVKELTTQLGNPKKQWTEPNDKTLYLWLTERTAVKVLVRDAGDRVRFEWYNYDINWFNANKQTLSIPE